jgi:hypothetical protein
MTLDELREIFKPQLDTGYLHLFYMVSDHSKEPRLRVHKCAESYLDSLATSLGQLAYTGIYSNMPRFA